MEPFDALVDALATVKRSAMDRFKFPGGLGLACLWLPGGLEWLVVDFLFF